MTVRSLIARVFQQEGLNFLLTNRIPRRLATRFMGWFSKIEQPLVRDISIGIWRLFCDLDLSEAKKTQFKSLHDCFIRELKDGARPIDPDPDTLVSPCDAIVGACGTIAGTDLLQVKGSWYPLEELLRDRELAEFYRDGCYVTLRLTAAMYHRFHAPHDCRVEQVTHIWGDAWNVNPIALERVEKLFCKNERVAHPRAPAGDRPPRHAGAGGRHPRRRHPPALPRPRRRSEASRSPRRSLRRPVPEGPGDGLVRARIDHHRARPEGLCVVRERACRLAPSAWARR